VEQLKADKKILQMELDQTRARLENEIACVKEDKEN
jgi:hypothetical protein